jgi:hypothetical protein
MRSIVSEKGKNRERGKPGNREQGTETAMWLSDPGRVLVIPSFRQEKGEAVRHWAVVQEPRTLWTGFPVPYFLFPIPCSLFPFPYSLSFPVTIKRL